jgi:hypothetical protein
MWSARFPFLFLVNDCDYPNRPGRGRVLDLGAIGWHLRSLDSGPGVNASAFNINSMKFVKPKAAQSNCPKRSARA